MHGTSSKGKRRNVGRLILRETPSGVNDSGVTYLVTPLP